MNLSEILRGLKKENYFWNTMTFSLDSVMSFTCVVVTISFSCSNCLCIYIFSILFYSRKFNVQKSMQFIYLFTSRVAANFYVFDESRHYTP